MRDGLDEAVAQAIAARDAAKVSGGSAVLSVEALEILIAAAGLAKHYEDRADKADLYVWPY